MDFMNLPVVDFRAARLHIQVDVDANGMASVTVNDIDGGSTDNCGIDSIWIDNGMFDCNDVGTNLVTLTAVDSAGNMDTCTAIVTVIDTVAYGREYEPRADRHF